MNIEMLFFSDRQFAVIGHTKGIESYLRLLGGSYEENIRDCGKTYAGWVFNREPQLIKSIASYASDRRREAQQPFETVKIYNSIQ